MENLHKCEKVIQLVCVAQLYQQLNINSFA